jgi:hypothetical protein
LWTWTIFVRQAANLRPSKERLWWALQDVFGGTHGFAIGDRNHWALSLRNELATIWGGHTFTDQRRLSLQHPVRCLGRGGGVERISAAVEDAVQGVPDRRR